MYSSYTSQKKSFIYISTKSFKAKRRYLPQLVTLVHCEERRRRKRKRKKKRKRKRKRRRKRRKNKRESQPSSVPKSASVFSQGERKS
jgi:hypothetical protein